MSRGYCAVVVAAALLFGCPRAIQAQAAGLSCGEASGDTSASSGPECWEGTLKTHAQGNMYNDTANGKFAFTVADDGAVNGSAHISMSHAAQTMPSGCVYTRTQDPEEFDVAIGGRRETDRLELNFGTAKANYTIAAQCRGHSGARSNPGMDAFTGASDFVLHPAKVPAEDATTTLRGSPGGDLRMTATIQISCTRGCILPRAAD